VRRNMESVPEMEKALLQEAVDAFHRARILVLGDVMLDRYLWGKVSRISPEAPVPVVDVQDETKMLGGAGNVINNIFSLGARPILCGVIGDDATGREVIARVEDLGLTAEGLLVEPGRPTSTKTRIVAHSQQVVRVDRESRRDVRPRMVEKMLAFVEAKEQEIDVIIVSDYGKGVVAPEIIKGLRRLKRSWSGIVAVDPKVESFPLYRGVDVITPNHIEAGAYCGFEITDGEGLAKAGDRILKNLGCQAVLITQGEQGMTLFERGGKIQHIPTAAKRVYDVTGAGDTVIATFCLGLVSGLHMRNAAVISNLAAGIVVGEVGTSTVGVEGLKRAISEMRQEA
jgi:rfaE bifunctional protein kinase chain/domain